MARVRKDVWSLGAGWNDTVLWYAKAVRDLSSKPIVALAGWRFLAAMHGIDEELWAAFGYLASGETKPAQSVQKKFWNQCQHQTWYFLPWHRGYVAAFENIVRASIVAQGGPGDWALPYWNYNSPAAHANRLPWALEQKKLPDGADNPLFVQRRYGDGTGLVVLDRTRISPAQALADPDFAGPSSANPGFGGPQTKWHHGGEDQAPSGHLEQSPHNIVHSLIGGVKRGANPSVAKNVGLMAMPDTAALDPIFWLHHANIDRLWEVWLHRPTSTGNPTVATWLKGPPKRFWMPTPQGGQYSFTPADVLNLNAQRLGYEYDHLTEPVAVAKTGIRGTSGAVKVATAMKTAAKTELVGATSSVTKLTGARTVTSVRMDKAVGGKMLHAFQMAAASATGTHPRDRVFLNLEGIKGLNDSAVFSVYVTPPAKKAAAASAPGEASLVGTFSLFGARKASRKDGPHAGNGLSAVLEITDAVHSMHLAGNFDVGRLDVHLVPVSDVQAEDKITVSRISIYRTGN